MYLKQCVKGHHVSQILENVPAGSSLPDEIFQSREGFRPFVRLTSCLVALVSNVQQCPVQCSAIGQPASLHLSVDRSCLRTVSLSNELLSTIWCSSPEVYIRFRTSLAETPLRLDSGNAVLSERDSIDAWSYQIVVTPASSSSPT